MIRDSFKKHQAAGWIGINKLQGCLYVGSAGVSRAVHQGVVYILHGRETAELVVQADIFSHLHFLQGTSLGDDIFVREVFDAADQEPVGTPDQDTGGGIRGCVMIAL